jgi:hypothetical protein
MKSRTVAFAVAAFIMTSITQRGVYSHAPDDAILIFAGEMPFPLIPCQRFVYSGVSDGNANRPAVVLRVRSF